MKKYLYPNAEQSARTTPVAVEATREEDFPRCLTRLGARKVNYLLRGVAQVKPADTVLELFGGTGLGTVLLAKRLGRADRITTVDLHYASMASWRYVFGENYATLAREYGVGPTPPPTFLGVDAAARLPLSEVSFDAVLSADSPRTHGKDAGAESKLGVDRQRGLFLASGLEAIRVLRPGGVFSGTAPSSWVLALADDVEPMTQSLHTVANNTLSPGLRFKETVDTIVYFRLGKHK